jgi:hypothetical protein
VTSSETTSTIAIVAVAVSVANSIFLVWNASASRRHERRMPWEARAQERRGDVYVDLLVFLGTWGFNLETHRDGLAILPYPKHEDTVRLLARLWAFGSDESTRLVNRWVKGMNEYRRAESDGASPDELAHRRAELNRGIGEIRKVVTKELRQGRRGESA